MFKVTAVRDRIFIIVHKDSMSGMFFNETPIVVYGFIAVIGEDYNSSYTSYANIADEVSSSKELDKLAEEAKKEYFGKSDVN